MICTTAMLIEQYRQYQNPQKKIARLVDKQDLFPLVRGLYETDRNVSGQCLAGVMFGPSYLSFDYALSYYGLIPEAVYTFTSATCDKKKAKEFENVFGRFFYRDVPTEVYPYGILIQEENGYIYQMASPEKALCDKLYTMPPAGSQKEIVRMLFEDLRIERSDFDKLNAEDIIQIGEKYHSNNLYQLVKYLRRISHE